MNTIKNAVEIISPKAANGATHFKPWYADNVGKQYLLYKEPKRYDPNYQVYTENGCIALVPMECAKRISLLDKAIGNSNGVEIPALFPTNNGIRIVTTREKPLTYMQAKRSLARKGLWFNRVTESKWRKYFAHNIRYAREGGFKTIFSEWESDIALLKFVQAYRMGFLDGQRNCYHNEALTLEQTT